MIGLKMPLESQKLLNNNHIFFPNAVSIFTDHLLVSKEAQAIIGGVVGFWGGVFGMGSVYLLVVCLRRIRKQVQNQRMQCRDTIQVHVWIGVCAAK